MAAAAAVLEKPRPGVELPAIRRFTDADLSRHGGWIVKRLMKAMPDLGEPQVRGWVRSLVVNDHHLFLFQEHSVALAQVIYSNDLDGKAIVREKFVFAEEGHADEAAFFYAEFKRWAQSLSVAVIEVENRTDVSSEAIKEQLGGRLFERKQMFARL